MEQQDLKDQVSAIIVFIKIDLKKQRHISCAIYNKIFRLFQVCDFNDNEHFSNLQSMFIQINPKDDQAQFKIYVQFPEVEQQKQKVIGKFGEQMKDNIIEYKFLKSKSKNIQSLLQSLLKNQIKLYYHQMKSQSNMIVLENLINQLKIANDQTNKKSFQLKYFNLKQFMKLDSAALNALQIFPKKMHRKIINANQTLFDILNRCKTAIGTRCLKRWMKQPLQQKKQILTRQKFIRYFLQNPDIKSFIQQQLFSYVPDLQKLFFTFYKVNTKKPTKIQMFDLIKFYKLVVALKHYKQKLLSRNLNQFQKQYLYDKIQEDIQTLDQPLTMIQKNISMDGKESQYYIKPQTNANLKRISNQKKQLKTSIQSLFQTVKQQLGIQLQLIQSNTYYLVFQGPKAQVQQAIKNNSQFKSISVKTTRFSFTNNDLMRLCGQIKKLDEQYQIAQKQVLKKMFSVVASFHQILQKISIYLSQLDVYTTFSSIISSEPAKWCVPQIQQSIQAVGIVHPCLIQPIPNSFNMNQNKTIIITGPNMGGKSTFIRTIGIGIYFAHIGFYAPAKSFKTPILDAIITRVGASDVQLKGISTFMSQMLQSACMLNTATQKSLVLIDQLGRGTSTHQGFGIAWAICQYMHKKIKAYCLFATHFHEMTKMPEQVKGVLNMHVSCKIHKQKLLMEYKLMPGCIDKSYGIQLAQMIGFPKRVIQQARRFANELQSYEQKITNRDVKQESKMQIQLEQKYSISEQKKNKVIGITNDYISKYGELQTMNEKRKKQLKGKLRKLIYV